MYIFHMSIFLIKLLYKIGILKNNCVIFMKIKLFKSKRGFKYWGYMTFQTCGFTQVNFTEPQVFHLFVKQEHHIKSSIVLMIKSDNICRDL